MFRYFKLRKHYKYYDKVLNFLKLKPVGYKTTFKELYEHITKYQLPKNITEQTENNYHIDFKKTWYSKTFLFYNSYTESQKLKDVLQKLESDGFITISNNNYFIRNDGLTKSYWSDYKTKHLTKWRVQIGFVILIIGLIINYEKVMYYISCSYDWIISLIN